MSDSQMPELLLGKPTHYDQDYSPDLLVSVPRQQQRATLKHVAPFGYDVWNAYEVSWLTPNGLPVVRLARLIFPAESRALIESKSLKLYLNSFNMTTFSSDQDVRETIRNDLSKAVEAPVDVQLFGLNALSEWAVGAPQGICLDTLETNCHHYAYRPEILQTAPRGDWNEETLFSHLLRSNCLVTGQPDWATVHIVYTGYRIEHTSLLQYLVSYRQHREFHEHCVERIFSDIWTLGGIDKLVVRAQYTRRGGLDINPVRSSQPIPITFSRWIRQ
ncbi:MAG: NADPH-dependent 7-cyano-7-deazaguanine reductase QueF [Gammaproteobacteria bacterium]|nr:MAG: NADPH-dependent 7-cyano-7-deazaguanine reductase QueF [Gammaproteobacteria bacterium]